METSDVRRRVKEAIERGRRQAGERRARKTQAAQAYERFLSEVAEPLFRQVADVLKAEGYPFTVYTPAASLGLASERSPKDFMELRLDTTGPAPQVVARVERVKGRETLIEDRPLRPGVLIEHLTEEDLLALIDEVIPVFVER